VHDGANTPSHPIHPVFFGSFHFVDTGPLIDRELELAPPRESAIDSMLSACRDPIFARESPHEAMATRSQLLDYIYQYPDGREPGGSGRVPSYHFWMYISSPSVSSPGGKPAVRVAGGISLRAQTTRGIEMYYGHFGYRVYPFARGHHYAERACRLLLPLARRHGIQPLWITCNPDNLPSRRTCERLGAKLVEIVPVPPRDPLYLRGDHEKCRYRLDL
jgi:tagatose 1,6-diphosphate aldolase